MDDKNILNILQYWENISECVCDSTTPIGGCLKCDMRECIDGIIMLKQDYQLNKTTIKGLQKIVSQYYKKEDKKTKFTVEEIIEYFDGWKSNKVSVNDVSASALWNAYIHLTDYQDGIEAYFERKKDYEKENEGIR